MPSFRSPRQRAEDAQVHLLDTLCTEVGRKEIADDLESVFSCSEAADKDARRIKADHGHQAFRMRNKFFWQTLESQVWTLVQAGMAPEAIYQKIAANASKQFGYQFLSSEDALTRLAARSARVAPFARVGRHLST